MTKKLFSLALILSSASVSFSSLARANPVQDDVTDVLYAMRSAYRATYAPAAWKKKQVNYDLATEFDRALKAVQANPNMTVADARPIFKQFIYSMQDYHTSIQFALTEKATLPFTVKAAGDRYFLVYVDRTKLSETAFPFQVGDELVTFGGQPTHAAVQALQAETPANVPQTDHALATMNLTRRQAARGYTVPNGPLTLGVLPKGKTVVKQVQILWDYTPERIGNRASWSGMLPPVRSTLFHPSMDVRVADAPAVDGNPYDLGARQTYTPDLGPKVWESPKENAFYAYVYKAPDRRLIGYLRLPGYSLPDYKKAVADFAAIVKQFERLTDGMVIDQVNNPGGSVFYLYTLVSLLSDQPMKTPRHLMSITQQDVLDAANLVEKLKNVKNDADAEAALKDDDFHGYPLTYQVAQFTSNYANFIIGEWNAGRKLSAPYWIAGVDQINPAKEPYTKPILILINNLDFSGGDFFPTIMQDNARATIMGSRTAGAGGYVNDVKLPNTVGISAFRTTGSLAERSASGQPIENLGVTPDVSYEPTVDDLQNNYAPYVKAINENILKLIK